MVSIRIKMNLRGLNALMRSAPAQAEVDRRGQRMAAAAGENFEYVRDPHKWVARGFVQAKNAKGRREEALEKRLNRALGELVMEFRDVESLARQRLLSGAYTDGAGVFVRVPSTRPATFLRVWRTGGAAVNRVLDAPLITVQSWSSRSDQIAVDNANEARQLLLNAAGAMPLVRGVEEVTGLYYDPDPVSGVTRYTFTVRMRVRAARS